MKERPIVKVNVTDTKIVNRNTTINNLICPENEGRIPFFSLPCVTNSDCSSVGNEMVCCSSRCIKGVLPKKPEIIHSRKFLLSTKS